MPEYDTYDSVCKECGCVIGDIQLHNQWHGKVDALFIMQMRF